MTLNDEISFLNYLIEYPELCVEKCKKRRDMLLLKRDAILGNGEQDD